VRGVAVGGALVASSATACSLTTPQQLARVQQQPIAPPWLVGRRPTASSVVALENQVDGTLTAVDGVVAAALLRGRPGGIAASGSKRGSSFSQPSADPRRRLYSSGSGAVALSGRSRVATLDAIDGVGVEGGADSLQLERRSDRSGSSSNEWAGAAGGALPTAPIIDDAVAAVAAAAAAAATAAVSPACGTTEVFSNLERNTSVERAAAAVAAVMDAPLVAAAATATAAAFDAKSAAVAAAAAAAAAALVAHRQRRAACTSGGIGVHRDTPRALSTDELVGASISHAEPAVLGSTTPRAALAEAESAAAAEVDDALEMKSIVAIDASAPTSSTGTAATATDIAAAALLGGRSLSSAIVYGVSYRLSFNHAASLSPEEAAALVSAAGVLPAQIAAVGGALLAQAQRAEARRAAAAAADRAVNVAMPSRALAAAAAADTAAAAVVCRMTRWSPLAVSTVALGFGPAASGSGAAPQPPVFAHSAPTVSPASSVATTLPSGVTAAAAAATGSALLQSQLAVSLSAATTSS